jgi:cellulose synthase (UDP-forming)
MIRTDHFPPPGTANDGRADAPAWRPERPSRTTRWKLTLLAFASTVALAWYLWWLLQPGRVGNPILFAILVTAELFNVVQAVGFWWTCALPRRRALRPPLPRPDPGAERPVVDVFIPTYNEPAAIVEPTVAAATRLRGARVRVFLLDDGNRKEMEHLAARWGARYVRRSIHSGAKAGNINHALGITSAPYVAVLDCDHVPHPDFLAHTLGRFQDPHVAFVQTPQYYANEQENTIAAASWSQQALFFGPIAIGKDDHESMFCCGTNVVFRRAALEAVGGFPENSLTEDFELSLHLHEAGWRSAYVPEVLASGLGPEDLASYVSQQHRWARGCVSAIPRVLRSRMPLRQKAQYLLSASYFLSGWTVLVYVSLPAIRILTGLQPIAGAGADQFLAHFAGFFGLALLTVAAVGSGTYTFAAYSLATSTFWIHVHASLKAVFRRPGRFVVTPKSATSGRQWRPIAPTLAVIGVLALVAIYGLARDQQPATLNNVAFAWLHIAVLGRGIAPALLPALSTPAGVEAAPSREQAA